MRATLVAALMGLMVIPASARGAPLTRWLDAVGTAAAAADAGRSEAAATAARAAWDAIPRGAAGARAQLLAGVAASARGRHREAVVALRMAAPGLPPSLRAPTLERLGAALALTGHPRAAAEAYAESQAAASPERPPRVAVARARALLADGRPGAAASALDGVPGDPATLALAEAWLALGDTRARAALVKLAVQQAGGDEGEAAAGILERSPPPLNAVERLARAEKLLGAARPAVALREVERAADGLAPSDTRPAILRAVALLQLGQPAEAERLATPIARTPGPGDPAVARWVLARAAARQGRVEEAARRYGEVARERPAIPGYSPSRQADLPDDAAYLSAWLLYEAGRFDEAAAALAGFLRERPLARRAPEAHWFRAWALRRAGRVDEARQALREIAARGPASLRGAALYWRARLAPSRDAAEALYREAFAESPTGWYALLAARRLAEAGLAQPPLVEPPDQPPPRPPSDAEEAHALARAADLLGVGLRAEGLAVIDALSRGPGARARAARVAELAAFAGDAEVPYRMARDHLPPGRRTERWAYPDGPAAAIREAAAPLGVDVDLVLAVMRRESAFQARARSGAGAEGLLQVRPATASRVRSLLGLAEVTDAELLEPAENTRVGIAYLGLLASRFPAVPATLAGYNAGPVAAAAWARDRAGWALDEWVEDIPYRETRQYVRAVVADWAQYRRIHGRPPPPVDPAAPVTAPGEGVAF